MHSTVPATSEQPKSALLNSVPAGNRSLSSTSRATEGPLLSTEIVYVSSPPGVTGLADADLPACRSALVLSVIVPSACTGVGAAVAYTATVFVSLVPLGRLASVSTGTVISTL